MNKKQLWLTVLLGMGLTNFVCFGQDQKLKAVELIGGFTKLGYYGNLGVSNVLDSSSYVKVQFGVENASVREFKFKDYRLMLAYYYRLFQVSALRFHVGGGLAANITNLNTASLETVPNKTSYTSYGLVITPEAEYYVKSRLAILANFQQQFNLSKEFGKYQYYAGLGLKYTF